MNVLDAELVTAGRLARGLIELDEDIDEAGAMSIERVVCDLPVELAARDDADGALVVLLSPPRQPIVTTVMPVFHRLRITVVRDALD